MGRIMVEVAIVVLTFIFSLDFTSFAGILQNPDAAHSGTLFGSHIQCCVWEHFLL